MTAQDLSALADKLDELDELAMKATPGEWYSEGGRLLAQNVDQDDEFYSEPFSIADFVMDTRIDYDTAATANAALSAAMKRALPQITTALREAARLREAPSEPGEFVGDIFYGNPERTTEGTHRWTGSEWVRLPTDAEALTALLAKSREEAELLRASLRDTLDFLERHSNRWDGVNGKHPQTVVTAARAALKPEESRG